MMSQAINTVGGRRTLRPLAAALDLLFPPQCAACGLPCELLAGEPYFCCSCSQALDAKSEARCPRCAQRCSTADLPLGNCGECRSRRLQFSAARTIGAHAGALREAVLKAKHAFHEPLAIALGQRLAATIQQKPFAESLDVVIPVPMHWLRRLSRKTHPAGTMARAVAHGLSLPLAARSLICSRLVRHQSSLSGHERRKNVRGAFSVRWKQALRGKRILLVDDVMTTGATAHECARVLLEAGAASVYVATVARNSPDF